MAQVTDDDLKWLLELLEQEQLAEIEITTAEASVVLKAAGASLAGAPLAMSAVAAPSPAAAQAAPSAGEEAGEKLLAPMGGIFYRSSSPETPPYAEVGDEVHIGDTVGLIEAMKLYNEVSSHVHGKIIRFLVENEAAVEADQPLVLIERTTQ